MTERESLLIEKAIDNEQMEFFALLKGFSQERVRIETVAGKEFVFVMGDDHIGPNLYAVKDTGIEKIENFQEWPVDIRKESRHKKPKREYSKRPRITIITADTHRQLRDYN